MASRINWINFGKAFEFNFQSKKKTDFEFSFSSLQSGEKKELILETLKDSIAVISTDESLHQKFLRLIKHIEIDDKANSLRIIVELLVLLEYSQYSLKFVSLTNFLKPSLECRIRVKRHGDLRTLGSFYNRCNHAHQKV